MKPFTIWLNHPGVALFIGGDPGKGQAPIITITLERPQVLVDPEKNTIVIVETK